MNALTISEIQNAMAACYEQAVISTDMDSIVDIISYHTALAVAEAMLLESVDSIPCLQEA